MADVCRTYLQPSEIEVVARACTERTAKMTELVNTRTTAMTPEDYAAFLLLCAERALAASSN